MHAQASSDLAASSDTHRGARRASGSDNSNCHVMGTLRGTSRPHDATGNDNSDCHVTGTLRDTSRPHITDSTRGEARVPTIVSEKTWSTSDTSVSVKTWSTSDNTVSEKTWSTAAQLEDIFRQHTPATAKAPAVHEYVAKLVST